ncbi:putative cytochrome P450 17A1 [Cladorrhinum samala]|uniref:Cytochrome P450 17A1 n=1 Tax=Cladorrhinum samala TaxID=585594 RepID=A0AAV9HX62_9PEZI|nr:putative cytochrome P450 17A1 [Cladorrhinum samala]
MLAVIATTSLVVLGLTWLILDFPRLQRTYSLSRHRSSLPPSPKQIKTGLAKPWLWFRELHKELDSDVVYLQLGPTPTILLGSAQAAWDLLEKRGAIYSSRPRFIMGQELLSNNMRGLMAGYNSFWRRWRKLVHSGFMMRQSEKYRWIQNLESEVLMGDLLRDPGGYRVHLERYAASVIVMVTYGRRVVDVRKDVIVEMNREAMERLTQVNIPGKYAVERYPALKYVPAVFAPWKRQVLEQRKKDIEMYTTLIKDVKSRREKGTIPDCFATHLLDEQQGLSMTDLEVAYAAGTPFGAGIETSAGSLASFILACVKFGPQFIPKALAELDRVVGRDRLPTFDDLPQLEYIGAIVSETLRWRPVAVLGGTPHATTADDWYESMFIPKGSTIIASLWSIHLNEKDFPDPHAFRPERFLEGRDYPGTFGHSAFGWGRRICPGLHLGQASVAINIARILWGFDIKPAKDESGRDIDVDIFAFTTGFNSVPLPFQCEIKPRSNKHVEVIQRQSRAAGEKLKAYDVYE